MTQEERVIANINKLGLKIEMNAPLRPYMLGMAEEFTKAALETPKVPHLATVGVLAFAIAILCPK